jgi:NAD+ kinase
VASEAPGNYGLRTQTTECYVHQLLEAQRRSTFSTPGPSLGDIKELASDTQEDGEALLEPKSRDGADDSCGLEFATKGTSVREPGGDETGTGEGQGAQVTHSRLLTKKQLSDMAWGVRELSKRLGSIRLKLKVKTVFLLTKAHDETLIENTREVARWLLSPEREVKYVVYVEENLKENRKFAAAGLLEDLEKAYEVDGEVSGEWKGRRRLRYWTNEMCRARPHTFDFVVTLGGDGTVLYSSWLFQRIVPPVLSFALGSLGFLTKFDYDFFQDTLTKAFNDGVTISLRLRFEGTVMRSQKRKRLDVNGEGLQVEDQDSNEGRDLVEELVGEEKEDERTHRPDKTFEILNDIVVDRGPNPSIHVPSLISRALLTEIAMSSIEIFGDDEHFTSVQADGVCVATPTGSTAYNLAAGGSLCHPENPVILVTAICAHTLSFRPIILPDTIVLRLGVPYDARVSSWASFDGRERLELKPGDYVTISASRYPFANVMQQGRRSEDWVNSISGKLGWNTRQRQKGYHEWEK